MGIPGSYGATVRFTIFRPSEIGVYALNPVAPQKIGLIYGRYLQWIGSLYLLCPIVIGVLFTNLANELGHHLVTELGICRSYAVWGVKKCQVARRLIISVKTGHLWNAEWWIHSRHSHVNLGSVVKAFSLFLSMRLSTNQVRVFFAAHLRFAMINTYICGPFTSSNCAEPIYCMFFMPFTTTYS